MKKSIVITGCELAEKLGIDPKMYPEFPVHGHGFIQPSRYFSQETEVEMLENDYKRLCRVENEKYNTGEVWDAAYDITYLYLGRIGKRDVVLTLGGDTLRAGEIEKPKKRVSRGPCEFLKKKFPQ